MNTNVEERLMYQSLHDAGIPQRLHGGIVRYIISGLRPGDFLRAVFANELLSAICRADDDMTIEDIRNTCKWIHLEAPAACHGSTGIVADYIAMKAKHFKITA